MFWKFNVYPNVSPVDAILNRPDFTLEELLDENDLLGDIKAHNNKLIDYMRQRDVLARLLDYVVAFKPGPSAPAEEASAGAGDETEDETGAQTETEAGVEAIGEAPGAELASSSNSGIAEGDDIDGTDKAGNANNAGIADSTDDTEDVEDVEDAEDAEDADKKRNKYAFVACEILASDNWSISEMLMDPSNRDLLHHFWQFLKQPAPLPPLQAGYFTKVNESLLDRKMDEMIEFLKAADNIVQDMLCHVDCPMIMDVLLKIVTLDRLEGCHGIVEWLYTQNLMPTLLAFLHPKNSWAAQTSAGDFIKAIITVSANATQNEQACIGPNELTRQLVSHPCIDELIGYMLTGGNALTVGVGIVIEVIRKNNSDYDPDVGTEANSVPSSRDPIYLGILLRMFAENVPNFMRLMNNAPAQKNRLQSTFNETIEPLGFDRFKTCELMAELLHCSNMGLLNELGSEELIAARDAERNRLRREGRLTPNRGEDATCPSSSTDLLAMRVTNSFLADEGRRLEVTNVSPADDDGFEEVTHVAGLGDDADDDHDGVRRQLRQPFQLQPPADILPATATRSFLDKDDDDFVDEPLSSPRLQTHDKFLDDDDDDVVGTHFDDPELVVAPLSPSKKRTEIGAVSSSSTTDDSSDPKTPTTSFESVFASAKEASTLEGSDDFVTEATEPALSEAGKKTMSDVEKLDDSDSSIVFTPTISSLSDSIGLKTPEQLPQLEQSDEPIEPVPSLKDDTMFNEPVSGGVVSVKSESTAPTEEAAVSTKSEGTEKSEVLAVFDMSEIPEVPEVPELPEVPRASEAPEAPQKVPEVTETLEVPKSPEASSEEAKETVSSEPIILVSEAEAKNEADTTNGTAELDTADTTEAAEASIVIARHSLDDTVNETTIDMGTVNPVVGDFLKMQFVDYQVVPTILSFFFAYPWNNFLHNVVYDVVQQVFNGPMDRGFNHHLAISLFESADITAQIINGQLASEKSQNATKMRMGYMGHLTLIAEEVVKFTERNPPELLSDVVLEKVMSSDWVSYVEGPLATTRERDNAILGGVRPEVAMNNQAAAAGLAAVGLSSLGSSLGLAGSQGKSSALADAGLNGNLDMHGGNDDGGIGHFSISAGISSGFHSSSDEEDEDGDDNDDDITNEFRAYTDPLNTTSALLPPAIPPPPPPPPPLNIPPSRARLQLAARLAMNKRNAEAAAVEQDSDELGGDGCIGGSGSRSGGDMGSMPMVPHAPSTERLRNPFADDEDDDEDDDDDDDDEEDDDDEDGDLSGRSGRNVGGIGSDVSATSSGRMGLGWNRGNWWRSMVRSRDRNNSSNNNGNSNSSNGDGGFSGETEKFGDGRDSSSSDDEVDGIGGERDLAANGFRDHSLSNRQRLDSDMRDDDDNDDDDKTNVIVSKDEDRDGFGGFGGFGSFGSFGSFGGGGSASVGGGGGPDDDDDEEFGDFALPEESKDQQQSGVDDKRGSTTAVTTAVGVSSFFDKDREKTLFKPLAVHPPMIGSSSSNSVGGGIWPFFLSSTSASATSALSFSETKAGTAKATLKDDEATKDDDCDGLEIVEEDGHRVSKVTAALRRTSLEDPDEDEVVV